MPLLFKELENIFMQWKTISLTSSQDLNTQDEIKKRMLQKISNLLDNIDCREITVTEEINPDRTYGKLKCDSIVTINSKL